MTIFNITRLTGRLVKKMLKRDFSIFFIYQKKMKRGMNVSYLKRVWRIVSPLLLFFAVDYAVSIAATYHYVSGYDMTSALNTTEGAQNFIQGAYDMLLDQYLQLTLLAAVISLPFLLRMYFKEKRQQTVTTVPVPGKRWVKYVYAILLSAGVTLSVNLFLNAVMIFRYATDYQAAMEEIMTESLWLRILCIGIIMPVTEELIFRGLIYERLKDMTNASKAAVYSSIIFGLYHGSLIQGIYAFVLGWLIVYAYQKCGTFLVPVIMHIVSNMIGIGLNYVYTDSTMVFSIAIVVTAMIGVWAFFKIHNGSFSVTCESEIKSDPGSCDASETVGGFGTEKRYRPEDYYPKEPEDEQDADEDTETFRSGPKDGE